MSDTNPFPEPPLAPLARGLLQGGPRDGQEIPLDAAYPFVRCRAGVENGITVATVEHLPRRAFPVDVYKLGLIDGDVAIYTYIRTQPRA